MAYEYEESNKQIVFTVDNESSMNQLNERIKELEEVYRKAKAFDEIEQAYWKSNAPENFAYEFVRIFKDHFSGDKERGDDER